MELFYVVLFTAAAATAGVLEWTKGREVDGGDENKEFQRFRHNYVLVYGLMMGGDQPASRCCCWLHEQYSQRTQSSKRPCTSCNVGTRLFCCRQGQTRMLTAQWTAAGMCVCLRLQQQGPCRSTPLTHCCSLPGLA